MKASRDKYLNLFDEKLIDQELLAERLQELNQEFERQVNRQNKLEASLKGCDSEELSYEYVQEVMSHFKKILRDKPNDYRRNSSKSRETNRRKVKIDEEVQKDFIKQSLSGKKSDRDILTCGKI